VELDVVDGIDRRGLRRRRVVFSVALRGGKRGMSQMKGAEKRGSNMP
jgi:hypothetical protein